MPGPRPFEGRCVLTRRRVPTFMPQQELFGGFPDHARVWVYVAESPIPSDKQSGLLATIHGFLSSWRSHGRPVTAAAEIVANKFLLVSGYVASGDVSGCGIDASVRALDEAAQRSGLRWSSPLNLHFHHADGVVRSVPRGEFRRLAREGEISLDTDVYDPAVSSIADLRYGRFQRPASESWHSSFFQTAVPSE